MDYHFKAVSEYQKRNHPSNDDALETTIRIRFTSSLHADKTETAIRFYNNLEHVLSKFKKDKLYYKSDVVKMLYDANKPNIANAAEHTSFLSLVKTERYSVTVNF